ncbi:MAG: thiamine phosphate synthase [Azovibrio sp.]
MTKQTRNPVINPMTSPVNHPSLPPSYNGLYAITPDWADTAQLLKGVEAALTGGCRWLQYRDKTSTPAKQEARAHALAELCHRFNTVLIINDNISLAQKVNAAGVHLGKEDSSIKTARTQLGPNAIIGVSCYQDFALAEQAATAGANYIAFGAVYPSPTKPEAPQAPLGLFAQARKTLNIPCCAIGGITLQNAPALIAAGASMLAVITDLFQNMAEPRIIQNQARAYQQLFENSHADLER